MPKTKLDQNEALRHAGLVAQFMWEDDKNLDAARGVSVDYASVAGTLPDKVNDAPVYLVDVQGTAISEFGYSYPIEMTLKVYLSLSDEELKPIAAKATEEEEEACKQHARDRACKDYGELAHIAEIGAYSEGDNGEYWYPDQENGIDINKRILELESAAYSEGLHFALKPGFKGEYILEPATKEELEAYTKAMEEAEEEEE